MGKIFNYVIFFILLAIVLAVGITWYSSSRGPKDSTETSKPSVESLPNTRFWKIPARQSKLNFSEITAASDIGKNDLPQELQPFVLNKSLNQIYQKIRYSDGKNGYLVKYSLNASYYKRESNLSSFYWLSQEYTDLAKASGWKTIFISRTNVLALVELENSNYKMRLEQSPDTDNKEYISIFIVISSK